jgi:hypothetical protein
MSAILRFIVLIPHRDSGRLLWEYRRQLFAAGFEGAYSFPGVAPVAVVSQAFTKGELQGVARTLRALSVQGGRGGKIAIQDLGSLTYSPSSPSGESLYTLTMFGPFLDVPSPEFSHPRVRYRFPRLLLVAGLIKTEAAERLMQEALPQSSAWFFRAGMVANMLFRPLSSGAPGYSFEWHIGTPVWLPSYRARP